jgi:hypothetical protein
MDVEAPRAIRQAEVEAPQQTLTDVCRRGAAEMKSRSMLRRLDRIAPVEREASSRRDLSVLTRASPTVPVSALAAPPVPEASAALASAAPAYALARQPAAAEALRSC